MNHYETISKFISYVLRHEPWKYELELDDEGWVNISELLNILHTENNAWIHLTKNDLSEMIHNSPKKRHEIIDNKIRALYGHSTPYKLIKQKAEPPHILYHGTSPTIAPLILVNGLKPMGRQYVHLSSDINIAKEVGYRKSKKPIILEVKAKEAYSENINFYIGNEQIWLADDVPTKFITLLT